MSIDKGHNAYHVSNCPNGHASFDSISALNMTSGAARHLLKEKSSWLQAQGGTWDTSFARSDAGAALI